ncbi:DNA polymerase III subunit epsilon [Synechococcus phage S-CBWM1]|uniref:DNA polymerase III subunit epsilon n=1 Tax=Synechococcus phage S-CBWM1 TaxID=2053653 RepID=A0A3G1L3U4_9CAUD|nr:DNA polymerase III subunit epsilon [Synechococcus phage S-CBWM1]ATW62810.1 DNA polymerase III subunit epsilon [Synechococcus phage S-CBWM1]
MKTKPSEAELLQAREDASAWAAAVLTDDRVVYLDTETSGLPSMRPETEIVQLSITNWKGRPLLVSGIRPENGIPEEASRVHGLVEEDLKDCPTFEELAPLIVKVLCEKVVVVYNADFDGSLLWNSFRKRDLPSPQIEEIFCCMDKFSQWTGEWSPKKGDYKWQKLPNLSGRLAHDALVDCENLYLLIQKMSLMKEEEMNTTLDEINLDF